jgi:hypothetical protein
LLRFVCLAKFAREGSAISNWRVTKSCLGQVFNYKLGHFATLLSNCIASMQPLIELKTRPGVCPVSKSLSMARVTDTEIVYEKSCVKLYEKTTQVY